MVTVETELINADLKLYAQASLADIPHTTVKRIMIDRVETVKGAKK